MRFLLSILILIISATFTTGQTVNLPLDKMVAIDMRHGLSESRTRALLPLPDGRLAVATAGYINIFDGTSFINIPIDPENGITLSATGKTRQLFHDHKGRVWLKSPATRNNENEQLYIFDPVTGKDITHSLLPDSFIKEFKDIFVDESGQYWIIDHENTLNLVTPTEDSHQTSANFTKKPLINLDRISKDLPGTISTVGNNIYLCYDGGKICVVEIPTGMLKQVSTATLPKGNMKLLKAGVRWHNGQVSVAYHKHNDNHRSWIATLDTLKWSWEIQELPELIFDFEYDKEGNLMTAIDSMPNEIFCLSFDRNDGLWIGTKENGLRYLNPKRHDIIRCTNQPYPYPRTGYYVSDNAKSAAEKFALGRINCSAEDSISKYVYLGTPKGLLVIDSVGELVATLADNIGLPQHNVQSIVANVPYSGKICNDSVKHRDEVWFSTTTGFSRLRHVGRDSFEVIHLGILDGLELNGAELYPQAMHCDSAGIIVAGYPDGSSYFIPSEIDDNDHVIYHYPDSRLTDNTESEEGERLTFILTLSFLVILFIIFAAVISIRRKAGRNNDNAPDKQVPPDHNNIDRLCENLISKCRESKDTDSESAPYSDEAFVKRLNKIIEEHLGDESLNVVSLSRLMAMDRTNLYRKMQSVMGSSPSVYIKNMRLTAAARLLRETDIPIPEIARQTGFSSTKYFSSTFKETFGLLPNKYRTNSESSQS